MIAGQSADLYYAERVETATEEDLKGKEFFFGKLDPKTGIKKGVGLDLIDSILNAFNSNVKNFL